jgi:citrate lyase beta subunit
MHRSYLFAPGDSEKLLRRVFDAGADAVMLDLEDAVPLDAKPQAREMVAAVLTQRPAWVRINAVRTPLSAADLEAVAGLAAGIRIPKVESAADVEWVLDDDAGLRRQAEFARSLGFFGKSAIHPKQLSVLHEVFTPSEDEVAWAHAVLEAFEAARGNAVKLADGEFVDLPVAERARHLLQLAR